MKPGELERVVDFTARRVGNDGAVIILLDSDDDCPGLRGPELLSRARSVRADRKIGLALAKREFETWFLAAAPSLAGLHTLPDRLEAPAAPESIHGAKEWLGQRMATGYSPTVDQPALAAAFNLDMARTCASFDKLVREIAALLGAVAPDRLMPARSP